VKRLCRQHRGARERIGGGEENIRCEEEDGEKKE